MKPYVKLEVVVLTLTPNERLAGFGTCYPEIELDHSTEPPTLIVIENYAS